MKKIILCLAAAFVISTSAEACPYQKMAEVDSKLFSNKSSINTETFAQISNLRSQGAEKLEIGSRIYFGKPIAIALKSNNLDELQMATDYLKAELKKESRLRDVFDSNEEGAREIHLKLKPFAYLAGFTDQSFMNQIRQRYFGREIQRLQVESDEIKIWLRLSNQDRMFLSNLESSTIQNSKGEWFPVKSLADISIKSGVATIQHLDGLRQTTLQADLTNAKDPVPPILASITSKTLEPLTQKFPSVRYSFEGQKRQTDQTASSGRTVMPVMLFVMFKVLI